MDKPFSKQSLEEIGRETGLQGTDLDLFVQFLWDRYGVTLRDRGFVEEWAEAWKDNKLQYHAKGDYESKLLLRQLGVLDS